MTKLIPVNAPSAWAASRAVEDFLHRQGMPHTVGDATKLEVSLPDERVAITVTKPAGPRSTYSVEVTRG